jgi:hypothetical protein
MVMSPAGIGTKDDCAGEDQRQFTRPTLGGCLLAGERGTRFVSVSFTVKHRLCFMIYTDVELNVIVTSFSGGITFCRVGWDYHSSDYEEYSSTEVALLIIISLLVSCLAYASMEDICSSTTSPDFYRTTWRYIAGDRTCTSLIKCLCWRRQIFSNCFLSPSILRVRVSHTLCRQLYRRKILHM